MDEVLKRYLDTLMQKINDGQERLLDRFASLERDFRNTKEFLVGDASISSRRCLDLDSRVSKLETRDRRGPDE